MGNVTISRKTMFWPVSANVLRFARGCGERDDSRHNRAVKSAAFGKERLSSLVRGFAMLRTVPRRRLSLLPAAVLVLGATGCNTPETIGAFCTSAVTTISSTTNVFGDLGPSCLREVNDNTSVLGSFKPPVTSDQGCTAVANEADASIAAAKLLSEYFGALNSLATVGVSTASTDAGALATKAAAIPGSTANQQNAISSMAQDLSSGIMSAYQYRKLAEDLPRARKNVDDIVGALVSVIQKNYLDQLLNSEEGKLANPYKEFLSEHNSPEAISLLDQRWRSDEEALQTRRASAQSAITALQTLQKGFDQLADYASKVQAKEIPGLLAPYVSQLQTLIPQIQKAF